MASLIPTLSSATTSGDPWPDSSIDSGAEPSHRWFVLHTRSRQEKVVAEDLAARHVKHFLPLLHDVRTQGRRTVTITRPVFPGYVFVLGEEENAYPIDRNRRLVRIISVANQQQLTRELHHLYRVLHHGCRVEPHAYLQCGVRVEIRSGPLKGIQGVVENLVSPHRLVLQIDMLGKATAVEVDTALLEAVEPNVGNIASSTK